jgi:hypothetical protein
MYRNKRSEDTLSEIINRRFTIRSNGAVVLLSSEKLQCIEKRNRGRFSNENPPKLMRRLLKF